MSEQKLAEISDELDKLIRLQAINVVKDIDSEQGEIALLDSLGFRPVEIGKMLNKSPENVSVVPGNLRKKKSSESQMAAEQPASQPQQEPQASQSDGSGN